MSAWAFGDTVPPCLGHLSAALPPKAVLLTLHSGQPLVQDEDCQGLSRNQSGSTLRNCHTHTGDSQPEEPTIESLATWAPQPSSGQ